MDVTIYFFFFKQKTAYEMRISDWSSDVCSSDLNAMPMHRGIFIQTVPHCDPQGLSLFHSKNRPRHLIAICQHASRRSGVGPEVTISRGNCPQYFPWTGSGCFPWRRSSQSLPDRQSGHCKPSPTGTTLPATAARRGQFEVATSERKTCGAGKGV